MENQKLLSAVKKSDITEVRNALLNGSDVNSKYEDNSTPLMQAAFQGDFEIVKLLIEEGADINLVCSYNSSALMRAVILERASIVKFLINYGADVSIKNQIGATALFIALMSIKNTEIVEILINNTPDINEELEIISKDEKCYITYLNFAIKKGSLDFVKLLVEKGADINKPDREGHCPLILSCIYNHNEIIKYLEDKGAFYFINNTEILQHNKFELLHYSLFHRKKDIALMLIKNGADVSAKGYLDFTPLIIAAARGMTEIVKIIVDKGANVNDGLYLRNRTALHFACLYGHYEIAEYLIENGADVNKAEKNGITPLIYASMMGHFEIARLLIKSGADVDTAITESKRAGRTALIYAAINGNIEIVKLLLHNNANVNKKDINGFTALKYALKKCRHDVAKLLVQNKARFNKEKSPNGIIISAF